MRKLCFALLSFLAAASLHPQTNGVPDPPHREWKAGWITHPTAPRREPIVLHFRHSLTLGSVPTSYIVRVSADNRFILYVNGKRVGDGPARGDLVHWRYERFDLAPLLKAGDNLIAATVWNFGVYAPIAQMSDRTAFLLESEADKEDSISTPKGWMVEVEPGHRPLPRVRQRLVEYFASGPGEEIDAAKLRLGLELAGRAEFSMGSGRVGNSREHLSLTRTRRTRPIRRATIRGAWFRTRCRTWSTRRRAPADAVRADTADLKAFPSDAGCGARRQATSTSCWTEERSPRLTRCSRSPAARVRRSGSPMPKRSYDKEMHKGDRNDVGDRVAVGIVDSFLPDGGAHRTFEPLWWRTWRYLDLDVQTADQPLQLESLVANFTAYPFEERASFKSGDAELDKIWEISWRTARLDAHETYMDTPYYEQLQYIGDTRVQALISYSVAGDDRLANQAMAAFDASRIPEGPTRSRYPSTLPQTIPTFSLLYIGMLHDYWMYRPDPAPVRDKIEGTRGVLSWFAKYEQPDGLLREAAVVEFCRLGFDGRNSDLRRESRVVHDDA